MQNAKLIAVFAVMVSINTCVIGGKTVPFHSLSAGVPGPPGPAGPGTFTEETSIVSVRDYGAIGDGVIGDRNAIYNAIAAASNRELLFPAGTYRVESELTFGSTVAVRFLNGAKLVIDSGVTVTINGPLEAGLYQVFSGDGSVNIGKGAVPMVYPQWWGAVGDDNTDNSDAFYKALEAAKNGGTLYIPAGVYILDTPISNFPYSYISYEKTGIVIRGAGMGHTILRYTGTSGYCVELGIKNELTAKCVCYITLADLHIQAPNIDSGGGGGVLFAGACFSHLERVAFTDINGTHGIAIAARKRDVTISDGVFTNDTDRDFTTTGEGACEKYAIRFTATPIGMSKVKQVRVRLARTGFPSGAIAAYIYDDSSGKPGTQIGGSSDQVNCATLEPSSDGGDVNFTFTSYDDMPEVSGNTDYWLVLATTGYEYADGVAEIRLRVDAGDGDANEFATYDADTSTWSTSNDGSSTTILLRYGQSILNKLRGVYVYGATRASLGVKLEESSQFHISDSNIVSVAGISAADSSYLMVSRTQISSSGGSPLSIMGGESSWLQCYIEGGTTSYPMYFDGGTRHTLQGCHLAGYLTWTKGTPLEITDCFGPAYYTDDATIIYDWTKYVIIDAGDNRILLQNTVVADDAGAVNGRCIKIDERFEGFRLQFDVSVSQPSVYTRLPRGTYLVTLIAKDTNAIPCDFRVRSGYYVSGVPSDLSAYEFTLNGDYSSYKIFHVITSDEVGKGSYIWCYKNTSSPNTISVSHIVVEYLGSDVLLNHDTVSYNSEASDAFGARRSEHIFIGRQLGGERSALAAIAALHDGSSNDEKGKLEFAVNRGNDGFSPTTFLSLDSAGKVDVSGRFCTSTITTFSNSDTTPSVSEGNIFKTANSSNTTITMFDDGAVGQKITIIIGDNNTKIDFTGTNLKGNNATDWAPTLNDHMICVFDGTNWYCITSDNAL